MTPRRTSTRKPPEATAEALTFEEAFAQLQTVIGQLEGGELPLDAAVVAFEQGMRLAQHCNTLLDGAELRVQALEPQPDGSLARGDMLIETE